MKEEPKLKCPRCKGEVIPLWEDPSQASRDGFGKVVYQCMMPGNPAPNDSHFRVHGFAVWTVGLNWD